MAKAKKQALTTEERLAQALVPEDEQPYEVPENWVWTRISNCFEVTSSKRVFKDDWKEVGIPFYRTRELVVLSETGSVDNALFITEEMYDKYASTYGVPKSGDLLVSGVGTIGVPYVVQSSEKFYFKDGNIIWFIKQADVDSKYIFYLYKSLFMVNQIKGFSSGTTVDTYTIVNAKNTAFPLPPLPEQHHIVTRIESLFEKLDRAKALVQSALDSFETRRAAILHKAFTGELTAKWREENRVGLESWEEKPLSELCSSFQYGTSKKSDKSGEVVVLRMGNLQGGEIDWGDLAYSNDEDDNEKYKLSTGDVLFNRTNSPEHVGKTSVYRGDMPAIFAGYLIRINYGESLDGYYLNYVMNSQRAREYCRQVKTDGVNQSNINAKKLAAFAIPHCGVDEQHEIVRILDSLLEKEQAAQELTNTIEKIDHMKKAILARAFRGELGTNDPSEESALELLKEVIEI